MGWAGSRKKNSIAIPPSWHGAGPFALLGYTPIPPPPVASSPHPSFSILSSALGHLAIITFFSSHRPLRLLSSPFHFFPIAPYLTTRRQKKKKRGESKTKRRLHSFTPSPRVPSPLPPPQSAFARVRVLLPNPPRTDEHHELIGSVVLVCSRLHCVVAFFVFFFLI